MREKHIEEMTKDLCDIECKGMKCNICDSYGCEYRMKAEALYNAGYRKQIEGEWLRYGYDSMKCSLCGKVNTNYNHNNFCPNCGARMKGENK